MNAADHREQVEFVDAIWPDIRRAVVASASAVDTSKLGTEMALKLAADIAILKWVERTKGER